MRVLVAGVVVGMDVRGTGMPMSVDMDQVMGLKQRSIVQYLLRRPALNNSFVTCEYAYHIG